MRTTVELPDGLLEEAQRLTGAKTKRQTVITALEEVIGARLRQRLIDRLGNTKLNLTMRDIREMRRGRKPPPKDAPLMLIGPFDGSKLDEVLGRPKQRGSSGDG